MEAGKAPVIVVGVDGTAASRAALEFALREGAARGSAVEVVTVWNWAGPYESLTGPSTPHEAREHAQHMQDEAVAAALRDLPVSPVVSRQVIEGDAARVLAHAGSGADYLVVGRQHKGVLKRAVLGSVSAYCVRHAPCPVLVVPTARPAAAEPQLSAAGG